MTGHPRLYLSGTDIERLREPPESPLLQRAAESVESEAEGYQASPRYDYPTDRHNAHLVRARIMQKRVVTLLVRWLQTGDTRFGRAAMDHVRQMADWEYWSWITWRQDDPRPEAIFDLSYGENSATLALAYDLLFDDLTSEEREFFHTTARERSFLPFLAHTGDDPAFFYKHPDSNWNSVCAGGAGLLALAMWEESDLAAEVLARTEASLIPFMGTLERTAGAWTEGIGYWNYGMRYAFMYLLSHERSFGKHHPLLQPQSVRASLRFPLDFCPNGVPCSFGDSNSWRPLAFHYAAAGRLDCLELVPELDRHLSSAGFNLLWPDAAELLVLHPRGDPGVSPNAAGPYRKLYGSTGWGVLADRMPEPRLYVAVRGGQADVPHGHRDLLSFHLVVGDRAMVTNVGMGEYLDTTFGPRREEMFETMPLSKNTILIGGVGITSDAEITPSLQDIDGCPAIRMDATAAMGSMRDGPQARLCVRHLVLLEGSALLVIDRVVLHAFGRVEARYHSPGDVHAEGSRATITSGEHRVSAAWASDVESTLHLGTACTTVPEGAVTMLRWCANSLVPAATWAALFSLDDQADVALRWEADELVVDARGKWGARALRLSDTLKP